MFNENPHFINLIQEDSIPLEMIQKELFLVNQYKNYLRRIKNKKLQIMAEKMLDIYKHPQKYDDKTLKSIQIYLEGYNVILQFSKVGVSKKERIVLDYCIYGNKEPINIIHPLFNIKEKIYNIQPFIYYDEFNTSNSTFYFDMIYINPEEVQNDYTIAKMVLAGEQVDSMFFVGSRITEDIKHCIKNAFVKSISIKSDILKMFEIHELTHKILNNHYNYFDQVTGEELALLSTIYPNPFLGLSVLYSYMDYNAINPHKIAALNFIRFLAERTGKSEFIDNPSLVKYMDIPTIKKLSKEQFNSIIKNLR
ncbi:MAG: hypothetical protein SVZ03_00750 [Spirochaetota bacterium]|nr:hypothetical protein [Spirochaetota bacterium]